MLGIEAVNQAVQEPPARRAALDEEPIHRGRQPHHAQMPRERRLALGGLAIDQQDPPLARLRGFPAGADLERAAWDFQARMDRPGAARGLAEGALGCLLPPVGLAEPRPPEAPAGCQERERLEQIGLARAIRAEERHRRRRHLKPRRAIAAEVREHEAPHGSRARGARERRPGQSQDAVIASHAGSSYDW